jgi:hypothetical protein
MERIGPARNRTVWIGLAVLDGRGTAAQGVAGIGWAVLVWLGSQGAEWRVKDRSDSALRGSRGSLGLGWESHGPASRGLERLGSRGWVRRGMSRIGMARIGLAGVETRQIERRLTR